MFVKPPFACSPLGLSNLFPLVSASIMPVVGDDGFAMCDALPTAAPSPAAEPISHSAMRHVSIVKFVSKIPEKDFEAVCEKIKSCTSRESREMEAMMRLAKLPFTPVEAHPELARYADEIVDAVDDLRRRNGFLRVDRSGHSMRLIDAARFDTLMKPAHDIGEQYGTISGGIAFARFDEEEYSTKPYGMPLLLSIIAHELVHPGVPGIGDYSHLLNEGIVEKLTRDIFASRIRPKLYPDFESVRERIADRLQEFNAEIRAELSEYREGYGDGVLDDGIFDVEDVVSIADEQAFLPPYYQEQVAFVRFVERDAPAVYETLVLASLEGESHGAHNIIARRYGVKLADMLAMNNPNWSDILTRSSWK
jgi:hypothetical protein